MPKKSSKHPKREIEHSIDGWPGGYNKDQDATVIPTSQLSRCKNLKYAKSRNEEGREVVSLKERQGTTKISNTALPSSAYPVANTYYKNQSQYIVAGSDSKLYYLDNSNDPQLIGTLSSTTVRFTEFNQKLIIHDTGTTKYWDGTTFEELDCRYEDESIGTGNDSTVEYTHTCSNLPVETSSLTISFTDSTAKTITDNGTGALTGNVDSSWAQAISNCADNGSGLIRVTTTGAHGYSTSDEISIAGVVGTTEANSTGSDPTWTITSIDATNFDLQGSTFTNAYTSGGTTHKNTVIYSTGALKFKCDGAPDDTTAITCTYDDDGGAPTSKVGLVRAGRLYAWGDSTNTSRLWYTAANDEEAWDSSSGGGYLDCDKNDGYTLVSVLNFFQSLLLIKDQSMHRLDNFPGDSTFRIEPLLDEIGCKAYRTALNEGNLISFASSSAWEAMSPSERYGDVQKTIPLSRFFQKEFREYIDENAVCDYNQIDKQLWLNLYDSANSTYLSDIHVINLDTGGQLSLYKFAFGHSCFKYVNGEMLIGGSDGHLYKLDATEEIFLDNSVSYSSNTCLRTAFSAFNAFHNKKLLKEIYIKCSGKVGMTATINIYIDRRYTIKKTLSLALPIGDAEIYADGDVEIADLGDYPISAASAFYFKPRIPWKTILIEMTDIHGLKGCETLGFDMKSALIGDF